MFAVSVVFQAGALKKKFMQKAYELSVLFAEMHQ